MSLKVYESYHDLGDGYYIYSNGQYATSTTHSNGNEEIWSRQIISSTNFV